MAAAERTPDITAVGLVLQNVSLGEKLGNLLKAAGLPVAFKVKPGEVKSLGSEADVVVVAGDDRTRSHGVFKRIRARLPHARVVACLPQGEAPSLQWVIDNGIDGVVWDARLGESLEATLRAVHAGQLVFPRDLQDNRRVPDFTNREKQALSLMIMGLTNREIADKLFVSENTVKSHLNTAYRKLGAHSRAEATRMITDPDEGLGTGILAITAPGLRRSRS